MKEKNFVSCVIYMHNEERTLTEFLDSVRGVMEENFEKYEIICVDDASEDGTVARLQEYVRELHNTKAISLIRMSYYQGLEAAMNAGSDLAVGDFIFEFDQAQMDYDKELIMQVYHKALEGYDIVAAAPKHHISLSSKLFYFVYNLGSRGANKLQQERFRLVSRRAVNRVNQLNAYVPYRKAMYVKCGLMMTTLSYDNAKTEHRGRNSQERGSRSLLAFDSFIIFTDILEKLSLILCGLFLLVMLVMAGYVVWSVFSEIRPVEGWMSTFGLISFGFFGLFLMLTLILKYLSVILNLQFRRQRYIISGIEKLTK
ncbi:MAG: glycosyltransferase [Lachnospiraceae bacterium]|nr:glycosyltransferase [Lachnospiraceae bacterium]